MALDAARYNLPVYKDRDSNLEPLYITIFNLVVNGTAIFNGLTTLYYQNKIGANGLAFDSFYINTATTTLGRLLANTAIGSGAGNALTSGTSNTLLGKNAGLALTTATNTTALGALACNIVNASNVTAVGFQAGQNSGATSTYMGVNSGALNTGAGNVAIGSNTLGGVFSGSAGQHDVVVGAEAGFKGSNNVAVGYRAGASVTGSDTVCIGNQCAPGATTPDFSVFIGPNCVGAGAVSGNQNTVVGGLAANMLSTGADNTMVGFQTGLLLTTGTSNTFIGSNSGNTTAVGATGITTVGESSGQTAGNFSTFIGFQAGQVATGVSNIGIGIGALGANTGASNIAIGENAGQVLTGNTNTFIGGLAGSSSTSSASNILIGNNCCPSNVITGSNLIAIGTGAANSTTSQTDSVFIGTNAGNAYVSGSNITAVGHQAGLTTTGSSNTYVGANSDSSGNFAQATAIGANAIVTAANRVQLGQDNTDDVSFGRNAIVQGAGRGILYVGTHTASGASAQTLNTMVGRVSFTGIASIAVGGNANLVINNSLVTANTVGLVALQGGTFAAGSNPVINTITYGAGTITINVINTDDTTATGAAGVLVFSFVLWQL